MSETLAVLDGNETARKRLLSTAGEPLFYADWDNVIFIHYQTDPQELQRCIPYHLDLYDGSAFVSLVAFTMRGMRPRFGGSLGALFFKPISTHHFPTFAPTSAHEAEAGIYFMQEWLSSRLATWLGPCSFGLPYRFAKNRISERTAIMSTSSRGKIEASASSFNYCATLTRSAPGICAPGFARRIFARALHRLHAIREASPVLSHLARTMAASCCGDPNRH